MLWGRRITPAFLEVFPLDPDLPGMMVQPLVGFINGAFQSVPDFMPGLSVLAVQCTLASRRLIMKFGGAKLSGVADFQ